MKILSDIGEDALISALVAQVPMHDDRAAQPGDDCAVLKHTDFAKQDLLLKTDAIVEGIHFTMQMPAREIGWKAIARVTSDFAAMGGHPHSFLVTIALPASTPLEWIEAVYQGMADCMNACGGKCAGGETTRTSDAAPSVISISALGCVPENHAVLRTTAQPGDVLMVTGALGGSFQQKHLTFTPRTKQSQWLTQNFYLTAMMDLSDGLAKDLPRLAKASGCGYQLDLTNIPVTAGCTIHQALTDGEDFELLFTVTPKQSNELLDRWAKHFPDLPLTRIGQMVGVGSGDELSGGWDHFK